MSKIENLIKNNLFVGFLILSLWQSSFADVKSTTGKIKFDIDRDGQEEAELNQIGLGVGIEASSNLHINGNAVVSGLITIGSASIGSSNLHLEGTLSKSLETITASSILSGNHSVIFVDTQGNGNINLRLPIASEHQGKMLNIKKIISGNQVLIDSVSLIDQSLSLRLDDGENVQLLSDGNYWYILSLSDAVDRITSPENLQLHLDFDFNLSDISGLFNDGSISGNTYANVVNDGAIELSSLNDVIQVNHSSTLDFSSNVTLSMWIKPNVNFSEMQSFSGWSSLSPPSGVGDSDPGDVAMTVIGNAIAFLSFQHDDGSETMEYGMSDRAFNGLAWTGLSAAGGAGGNESTSISLDSDGEKIIANAYAHNGGTSTFSIGDFDSDFSNFSGWTATPTPPTGAGTNDPSFTDGVIVNDNLHLVAFLHNNTTTNVSVGEIDKELTAGNVGWTNLGIDLNVAGGEPSSVVIESDGEKLYYVFFTNKGDDEKLYISSSDIDSTASGYVLNHTVLDTPDGAIGDYSTHVGAVLSGNQLHLSASISNTSGVEVFTASSNVDGSGFTGWLSRGFTHTVDLDERGALSLDMVSMGTNLHLLCWSGNSAMSNLMVSTFELSNSAPILSKEGAFSLNYSGGGLIFDWAGSPKSFGAITTASYHHVVVTYDGSSMKFYIDGQLSREQSVDRNFLTSSENLFIGGDQNLFFDGSVDDIRVYDKDLSENEVSTLYLEGR